MTGATPPLLPPAEMAVDCGGERHRLRWEGVGLTAVDHDDPEGEELLVALGAAPVACLALARAWREHRRDARLLALGPLAPDDHLVPLGGPQRVALSRLGASGHAVSGARGALEVVPLLELPRPMVDRLVADVWTARLDDLRRAVGGDPVADGPALVAAALARLRRAVSEWAAPESSVVAELTADGAALTVDADWSEIRATAGAGWLRDVWARQLALVDDLLVLEVLQVSTTGAVVQAVRWGGPQPAHPVTAVVRRAAARDGWERR